MSDEKAKRIDSMLIEIFDFIQHTTGLKTTQDDSGMCFIEQSIDGKIFRFHMQELEDVLKRTDADGKNFIQVNFISGHKVLFTDQLVGFKPRETIGLDMSKVPRVVTTPDLNSVFEAIEEILSSDVSREHELEILRKVYQSILHGAERVGFNLETEKKHFSRICFPALRASA